jgi:hypothetical protein
LVRAFYHFDKVVSARQNRWIMNRIVGGVPASL